MNVSFDKDLFEEKVKLWLIGKSHYERKPYYRFLTVINLMNLNRFSHIESPLKFQSDDIQSFYDAFRSALITGFFINAEEDSDIKATVREVDITSASIANLASRNTGYYATIASAAFSLHAITNTFDTSIANANVEEAARTTAIAASTAVITYKSLINGYDPISTLWSVIIEEVQDYETNQNYITLVDTLLGQSVKDIEVLLKVGLDFFYDDLQELIKNVLTKQDEKIHQVRLRQYCINLDVSSFVSIKQLRETLFSETDSAQVRVLIVGSGGAGKTSLFKLLSGKIIKQGDCATTKINQSIINDCTKEWNIRNPFVNKLDLSVWDFAGQTQYYGLHQSFFSNRCLYLLVIDSRHQQSPYDWLKQIEIMSDGLGAHVLIVVNNYENCPTQLNVRDIRQRFKSLNIDNNSIVELNLGEFIGKDIYNKKDLDEIDSYEYENFKSFLSILVDKSKNVQTQMSLKTLSFYNEINERINNKEFCFNNRDLKSIAEKHGQEEVYEELSKSFGNLVKTNDNSKVLWLSAQWLNQAGYSLFRDLQLEDYKTSYTYDEVIDRIENNSSFLVDDKAYDSLLTHLFNSSLAVSKSDLNKIIFPAVLSVNDPEFLEYLNNSDEFELYATFNIHVDFMQMGLFSQWLAEWLSESQSNNEIEIKEGNYSRYCCIISTYKENSKAQDVYLVIKWHPHYRVLTFSFYQTTLNTVENYLDSFNLLLHRALSTISSQKHSLNIEYTNILADNYPLSEEMTAKFLKDLKDISKKGLIYNYFNQSSYKDYETMVGKGDIYNIYGDLNKAGRDINKAGRDIYQAGENIVLNSNHQDKYIKMLDELETRYRSEKGEELDKTDNVINVISVAKTDVQSGELSETKVNAFDLILENLDKYNSILAVVSILLGIYPLV